VAWAHVTRSAVADFKGWPGLGLLVGQRLLNSDISIVCDAGGAWSVNGSS
jgi:hypothetical protein